MLEAAAHRAVDRRAILREVERGGEHATFVVGVEPLLDREEADHSEGGEHRDERPLRAGDLGEELSSRTGCSDRLFAT